jgi:hypothetical protein
MLRDREEVFRFIWENRHTLKVDPRGYTECISVRPCIRQAPDGFILRETVCEYVQIANIFGAEVTSTMGIERPSGMPANASLTVYGGGTLIFDQYGRIKYHVARPLADQDRQSKRLTYLWENGLIETAVDKRNRFAVLHRQRAQG